MRNIGNLSLAKVTATCGHERTVNVPPHRIGGAPGPKGQMRIAKAQEEPCGGTTGQCLIENPLPKIEYVCYTRHPGRSKDLAIPHKSGVDRNCRWNERDYDCKDHGATKIQIETMVGIAVQQRVCVETGKIAVEHKGGRWTCHQPSYGLENLFK